MFNNDLKSLFIFLSDSRNESLSMRQWGRELKFFTVFLITNVVCVDQEYKSKLQWKWKKSEAFKDYQESQ